MITVSKILTSKLTNFVKRVAILNFMLPHKIKKTPQKIGYISFFYLHSGYYYQHFYRYGTLNGLIKESRLLS
jgi:hypothetical protein